MRWNRLGIICFTALCMAGCLPSLYTKTPEGLNVTPLLSVELTNDVKSLKPIKNFLSHRVSQDEIEIVEGCNDEYSEGLSIYRAIHKDFEHRFIYISRFNTKAEALKAYISSKNDFDRSRFGNYKFYKEEGIEGNKYFCFYEEASLTVNHIYFSVYAPVEVKLIVLKRNLVIQVNYTAYLLDYTNMDYAIYINELNDDIAYAGYILKEAFENKH